MEQKKGLSFLRVTLVIYAFISLVYGIGYLFFPEYLVELSGGDPIPSAWLRWSGGVLISLGIGSILVIRNPIKQGIFVLTMAMGTLFVGLALLYAWIWEIVGTTWFTAAPAILILVVSMLLFWSRYLAKETLK
jgi:hypothetical protein